MLRRFWVAVLAVFAGVSVSRGAEGLKDGDKVAIIGDSITEQKLYSVYMEDYLLMCKPVAGVQSVQFGWGGETAPGFNGRIENDCLVFQPTIATTYYGMNDGGYTPYKDEIGEKYRKR